MHRNYSTYFPCVSICQFHCRNITLKETTSCHPVPVPAVSSSYIVDLHSINGIWCVSKVANIFFTLLQIITSLMVRSAVMQINLHLFCLDILCVGDNTVYMYIYIIYCMYLINTYTLDRVCFVFSVSTCETSALWFLDTVIFSLHLFPLIILFLIIISLTSTMCNSIVTFPCLLENPGWFKF